MIRAVVTSLVVKLNNVLTLLHFYVSAECDLMHRPAQLAVTS